MMRLISSSRTREPHVSGEGSYQRIPNIQNWNVQVRNNKMVKALQIKNIIVLINYWYRDILNKSISTIVDDWSSVGLITTKRGPPRLTLTFLI